MAPTAQDGTGTARDADVERVRTLARVLDNFFIDPLIGFFIPGGGDVLGSLLGMYTVVVAIRRKVSPAVIGRMLLNLAADAVIGFIPLVGDIFDFGFKANIKNAELLADRSNAGGKATAKDWIVLLASALAFFGVLFLVVWGIVALVRAIG